MPPRIRSLEVHRTAALQNRRSSRGDVMHPGFVGVHQPRHRYDKCSTRPDAKHRRYLMQHDSHPLLKNFYLTERELQRDVPLTLKVFLWRELQGP
jgi:hypothetical protein